MSYLDALGSELTAAGIRGRRRERILAEFADHLQCDAGAQLGAPAELARQFADELGTSLARRAAFHAFAALAVAGALFAAAWLAQQGVLIHGLSRAGSPLADVSGALVVLGPQVAFVAGLLALVRAWRRRDATVISRAEAQAVLRRAGLGLTAGLVSMVGLALMAFSLRDAMPTWWLVLTWSAAGVGGLVLMAAAPASFAAAPVRPMAEGPAGDVFDDLGPLVPGRLRGSPWWFAVGVAALVALAVTAAGALQADPFDGALRGVLDGAACLAGFGLLGRYLALRR